MAAWMRGKDSSRCLLLLAAVLMVESSQLGSSRAKLNSIKSSLGGETPLQASNRSTGTYQGLAFGGSKKGKNLGQKHPGIFNQNELNISLEVQHEMGQRL
uniref:Dickkopf WNT signaling pathway inhibitor 2 n=1 Tax=Myotis myotis TaxID=51298 RepID=A0A7J8AKB5_MYOMY|nr:dickkopf WNT signaling pathway inhibitor 2 [Myotis myotis]